MNHNGSVFLFLGNFNRSLQNLLFCITFYRYSLSSYKLSLPPIIGFRHMINLSLCHLCYFRLTNNQISNLPALFTPHHPLDIVGIGKDDADHFVADIGHAVIGHGAEIAR